MNKTELVSAMAERLGASKKHSEEALTVALDLITEALAEGERFSWWALVPLKCGSVPPASAAIPAPRRK